MKKSIKLLQDQRDELLESLDNPIKELGWEEILTKTEKLERVNNAIAYLQRNYS